MPKQLSEAAAWRKLAEWCGSGKPDRRAYLCDRLSGRFDDAYSYGPDSADSLPRGLPREAMHERIFAHRLYGDGNLIVDEWDRWGKHASERNHPRVIFCLLMAYECEEGVVKLTPQVIGAASMDAGNRSMRKAGRTAWNEEDREAAYQVNAKLWRIHDAEHGITPPPESERGGG